ncbi:hypothetical protein BH09GEM1_BH09GEM1_40360 [soil metagenome]
MNDLPPSSRRPWRTDAEWQRLRSRMDQASADLEPRRPWQRYVAGLAAACVVAAAGYVSIRRSSHAAPEWHVVTTPAGGRATLRLEDSTVVTLGPSTTLRYALTTSRRNVELEGLANFRVTHDVARTFRVRARNAVTTDLGTEFAVRAYRSDSAVVVAVTAVRCGLMTAATCGRSRSKLVTSEASIGRVSQVRWLANRPP